MKILTRGLLAATCASALMAAPAVAAGPSNVTVRAEGKSATVLPKTPVLTDTRAVNKDGDPEHTCSGTSAAGALEISTGGDWTGQWFDGLGYTVERIRTETHAFPEPEFWALWINNRESQVGICGAELQEADEVLFLVSRCDYDPDTMSCTNPPVLPLGLLDVPTRATPGTPFTVRVVEYERDGTSKPVAGATVSGGDAAVTTDAQGRAAVTLGARGPATLTVEKAGRVRDAEQTCVTDGADGSCGTQRPGDPVVNAEPVQRCLTSGSDGRCGTVDKQTPKGIITSVREGQRFRRGKAPRTLRGTAGVPSGVAAPALVAEPSGIQQVELRLTRSNRGSCSAFDGRRERFVRTRRCGVRFGRFFAIGDRADWEYLLPGVLPRGRYVLDVRVADRAGNKDFERRRKENRVVFTVS